MVGRVELRRGEAALAFRTLKTGYNRVFGYHLEITAAAPLLKRWAEQVGLIQH